MHRAPRALPEREIPTKLRAAHVATAGDRSRMGAALGVSSRTVARWILLYAPELHLPAGANQHRNPVESPPVSSV